MTRWTMRRLMPLAALLVVAACGSSREADGPDGAASGPGGTGISCAEAAAAAADFYTPPQPLPAGQPGDVIRCQAITTVHASLASATLVMHRTTDAHGHATATTGIVFEPFAPWSGAGPRPLLGFRHGTYGQGPQCANSRLMAAGVQFTPPLDGMLAYESAFVQDLLGAGIAVTMTDYQRFATPGVHTYFNRLEQAQANIDLVRAARHLPGTGLSPDGPLAFAGYSQGGLAAGGTAELLPTYAPELQVAGIYVGAPPRAIPELLEFLDNGSFMGVSGYYLNSLAEAHPEADAVLAQRLNAQGAAFRAATAQQCIVETALRHGYQASSQFTVSGETLPELLRSPALAHLVDLDRLGQVAPAHPVLLATGANDNIVPVAGVRRLREHWCALGTTAEYFELPGPFLPNGGPVEHIANAGAIYLSKARAWLVDRFNGVPAVSNCAP